MKNTRQHKIAEEIKRIVSSALLLEMKDPRLPAVLSITRVDVSADFKFATIYISAIDDQEVNKDEILQVLNGARGFFRKEIGSKLKTFHTPNPSFVYDESIQRGMEMEELLRKISHEE